MKYKFQLKTINYTFFVIITLYYVIITVMLWLLRNVDRQFLMGNKRVRIIYNISSAHMSSAKGNSHVISEPTQLEAKLAVGA